MTDISVGYDGRRLSKAKSPAESDSLALSYQDSHSQHVGHCGCRGTGVGHRLAADPGLGTLHQWQV